MYEVGVNNVFFRYGGKEVLKGISFTAHAGEFICLLGPSGCGKTTLLRLLAGLSSPTSGDITLNGKRVTGPGIDRGMVFQDYSLFPWMTAGQNVILALEQAFPGKTKSEYKETAQEYLEMVGLTDAFRKLPAELSGGMRQRAAIARVFAVNAPVLLMDEPFGALDAITRARLQDLLLELWGQREEDRKTIIFVTHDVDEAILLAGRIVILGLNGGGIREMISVNLPRPRVREGLYTNMKLQGFREHLLAVLHEELLDELDGGQVFRSGGEGI